MDPLVFLREDQPRRRVSSCSSAWPETAYGAANPIDGRRPWARRCGGLTPALASRLRRVATLEGHDGCVNRLRWSSDGRLLASVSDDLTVCLWRPSEHERAAAAASKPPAARWQTQHRANLFGAAFCSGGGGGGSDKLATCSMDGTVQLHDLNRLPGFGGGGDTTTTSSRPPPPMRLDSSARGRTKDVAAEPDDGGNPSLFFVAAEDGAVRQYDAREWGERLDGSAQAAAREADRQARNVIIQVDPRTRPLPSPQAQAPLSSKPRADAPSRSSVGGWAARRLKAVAVCPTRPHLLAVGCGDASARLYDRRMLHRPQSYAVPQRGGGGGGGQISGSGSGTPELALLSPPHLSAPQRLPERVHGTHVAFSPNGDRLLLNLSGEGLYAFDVGSSVEGAAQLFALTGSNGAPAPSSSSPSALFTPIPRHRQTPLPVATLRQTLVAVAADRVLDAYELKALHLEAARSLKRAARLLSVHAHDPPPPWIALQKRRSVRDDEWAGGLRTAAVDELSAAVSAAPFCSALKALQAALYHARAWVGDEARAVSAAEEALRLRQRLRRRALPSGFLDALGRGGEEGDAAARVAVARALAEDPRQAHLAACVEHAASRIAATGSAGFAGVCAWLISADVLAHRTRVAAYSGCYLPRCRDAAADAARARFGALMEDDDAGADDGSSFAWGPFSLSRSLKREGSAAIGGGMGQLWTPGLLRLQHYATRLLTYTSPSVATELLAYLKHARGPEDIGVEDELLEGAIGQRILSGRMRGGRSGGGGSPLEGLLDKAKRAPATLDPQWQSWEEEGQEEGQEEEDDDEEPGSAADCWRRDDWYEDEKEEEEEEAERGGSDDDDDDQAKTRRQLRHLSRRGGPCDGFADDARIAAAIIERARCGLSNDLDGGSSSSCSDDDDPRAFVGPRAASGTGGRALLGAFAGAANTKTDIKEAAFLGCGVVAAGSDDGRVFFWNASTGQLLGAADADADIVNCVQPSPDGGTMLATSGIENSVRLWSPVAPSPGGPCGALNLSSAIGGGGGSVAAGAGAATGDASLIDRALARAGARLDAMPEPEREARLSEGLQLPHRLGYGRVRPPDWCSTAAASLLPPRAANPSAPPPPPPEQQDPSDAAATAAADDPYSGMLPNDGRGLVPGLRGALLEAAVERNMGDVTRSAYTLPRQGTFFGLQSLLGLGAEDDDDNGDSDPAPWATDEEEEEEYEEEDEEDDGGGDEGGEGAARRGEGQAAAAAALLDQLGVPPAERRRLLAQAERLSRRMQVLQQGGGGQGGGGGGEEEGGGGGGGQPQIECRTM